MRKYALLIAALATWALPSSASAQVPANGPECTVVGPEGQRYVYTGSRYTFPAGTAPTVSAGACLDLEGNTPDIAGNNFDGGSVEAGANAGQGINPVTNGTGFPGVYVIADGDDDNKDITLDEGKGYIGLSNYETTSREPGGCNEDPGPPPRDPTDNGTGTNSGGCLTFRSNPSNPGSAIVSLPVPFIVGGDESNPWDSSSRDGWTVP